MRKKLIVAIVSILLVALCLPVAAMAESPTAKDSTVVAEHSAIPAGTTLVVAPVSGAVFTSLQNYASANGFGAIVAAQDITLIGPNGAGAQPDANTLIYVYCPGLHSNGSVTVMHMTYPTGAMEQIPASCGDGYFVFHPTSFSPFGYVVNSFGTAPGGSTSTTATSPRTGVYA